MLSWYLKHLEQYISCALIREHLTDYLADGHTNRMYSSAHRQEMGVDLRKGLNILLNKIYSAGFAVKETYLVQH